MARTTRRNKKHLIESTCGTLEDNLKEPYYVLHFYPALTPLQAHQRRVASYTRDHHSGKYGVPNWYRREHGVFRIRRREKHEIHRHLRNDSWDNHVSENRPRCAKMYWW